MIPVPRSFVGPKLPTYRERLHITLRRLRKRKNLFKSELNELRCHYTPETVADLERSIKDMETLERELQLEFALTTMRAGF